MNRKVALMMAIGVGAAAYSYLRVFRPRILRWGATGAELVRPMPGDDIVSNPTFNATRAITIHARPEDIWPWQVQLRLVGQPRDAHRIIPEFQRIEVGDWVPMSRWTYQMVKGFEPNRWLLWQDQSGDTWVWALYPLDQQRTRLVTRIRGRYQWASVSTSFPSS